MQALNLWRHKVITDSFFSFLLTQIISAIPHCMEAGERTAAFSWPVVVLGIQGSHSPTPPFTILLWKVSLRGLNLPLSQGIRFRGTTEDIFASPLTLPGKNVYWVTMVRVMISCSISIWIIAAFKPRINIISWNYLCLPKIQSQCLAQSSDHSLALCHSDISLGLS